MKKVVLLLFVFLMLSSAAFGYYLRVKAYYYDEFENEEEIFGAKIYIDGVYTGFDTPHTFSPYVGGIYSLIYGPCVWTPASAEVVVIDASGTIYFGTFDYFVPVELSSFTATISTTNYVMLNWITQSETNVSGFRIYRGTSDELTEAEMLSAFVPATNTSITQSYIYHDTDIYEDGTYYYWLENQDLDGSNGFHGPITATVQLHNDPVTPPIPIDKGINNIYPNPFNPSTTIEYALDSRGEVEISIYSIKGQFIRNLLSTVKEAGHDAVPWDGKDSNGNVCASGLYKVVMRTGSEVFARKAVLIK